MGKYSYSYKSYVEAKQFPGTSLFGVEALLDFEDWYLANTSRPAKLRGNTFVIDHLYDEVVLNPTDWLVIVNESVYKVSDEEFRHSYVKEN